jgi:hypothetical protein
MAVVVLLYCVCFQLYSVICCIYFSIIFNIISHFNKQTEFNFSLLSVVARLFGITFSHTLRVVSCLVNLFLLCYVTCSVTQSKRMQELLLLCFFVTDVTCFAGECTRSSCTFENFACYRHIYAEEK